MKYHRNDLEEKSYSQLQSLAKENNIKANGKKDELIQRILDHFSGNSTTTTTTTTSTKKESVLSKRKRNDEEEEEEKEKSSSEEEIEKPSVPIKKGSKKAAAVADNKKLKTQEKEEKSNEDDDDDDNTITPPPPPKQTTTTTTTTSTGADKLVGPFSKCEDDIKSWIRDGSVSYYLGELVCKSKIASFDMDSTLISNKSGKVHAINKDDWLWWDECVPGNLKKLYADGYQVVIFTNQGGIKSGSQFDRSKHTEITQKICILEKELGIPLVAFIACADDINRKPNKKMWDMMMDCTDGKVVINEAESFYCGDAAGRPDGWKAGVKKDFSNSDMGFAQTVGIRFETPETHFLGEAHWVAPAGSSLIPDAPTTGKRFEGDSITTKDFEIVVSVGYPASGKSTFARKYFGPAGYEIVNQDTLKTKEKCIKVASEALAKGKSVIIDNTNPTVDVRSNYIALSKKFNCKIRCIHFTTDFDLAMHLNYYRERTLGVGHISQMVYYSYRKNFQEPSTKEGFGSVTKINFVLELEESQKAMYFIANPKAKAKK